jgi:hypothetical protein
MANLTTDDMRRAAVIIGEGIADEAERAAVATRFARLFRNRFQSFSGRDFLAAVEAAHDMHADGVTAVATFGRSKDD